MFIFALVISFGCKYKLFYLYLKIFLTLNANIFIFMKGIDLKTKLEELGFSKAYIADKLGIPAQNVHIWLRAEDVKTGTLEKLSEVLGVPISYFYGEAFNISSVSGNNNTTATGNNNTVSGSDERLLTLLLNKDEQLLLAMKQTSKAQEQTDVVLKMLTEK